jgi:DNA-binding response OmpR family regulator
MGVASRRTVIIISAHHDEIGVAALDLGAIAVLGKPFDVDALLAAIRAALESSSKRESNCRSR